MTATPTTDGDSLKRLAECARDLRNFLGSFGDKFTLGEVEGKTMVGYLDENTGYFVAATIEDSPVIWTSPPRTEEAVETPRLTTKPDLAKLRDLLSRESTLEAKDVTAQVRDLLGQQPRVEGGGEAIESDGRDETIETQASDTSAAVYRAWGPFLQRHQGDGSGGGRM